MKFHPLVTKLLLKTEEKPFECRQSKDNYYFIADYILLKFHMHSRTMVIQIKCKFHEIPSIGYLVMAEDGKNH